MMEGPCEHCLNPDKSKWRTQCKYVGAYPSRRAFIRSTFDAPCVSDDHDETMRAYHTRPIMMYVGALLGLIAFAIWMAWRS